MSAPTSVFSRPLRHVLSGLSGFTSPKVLLEQYETPFDISAEVMEMICDDVEGKVVVDLGCGCGMLTMAAIGIGAKEVIGIDCDEEALTIAQNNWDKVQKDMSDGDGDGDGDDNDENEEEEEKEEEEESDSNDDRDDHHNDNNHNNNNNNNNNNNPSTPSSLPIPSSLSPSLTTKSQFHYVLSDVSSYKWSSWWSDNEAEEENDEISLKNGKDKGKPKENHRERRGAKGRGRGGGRGRGRGRGRGVGQGGNPKHEEEEEEDEEDDDGNDNDDDDDEEAEDSECANETKSSFSSSSSSSFSSPLPLLLPPSSPFHSSSYHSTFPHSLCDIVITNPPFGTRNAGIDVLFLQVSLQMSSHCVFSMHKFSTRKFLTKWSEKNKVIGKVVGKIKYNIEKTYSFHKMKSKDVEVDLWKFQFSDEEQRRRRRRKDNDKDSQSENVAIPLEKAQIGESEEKDQSSNK